MNNLIGQRIWIIGCPCSGKSTFSKALKTYLNFDTWELDSFIWQRGWERINDNLLVQTIEDKIKCDTWIIDGQYPIVNDLILSRADTIIWLDFPLYVLISRLIKRTFINVCKRNTLWNGNRESLLRLISRDSMIYYLISIYKQRKLENKNIFERLIDNKSLKMYYLPKHEGKFFLKTLSEKKLLQHGSN